MPTKIDFIGGNTKRCLMAMALPMIAAMFLNMMYNLVDSLWIAEMFCDRVAASKIYRGEKYRDSDPLDYFLSRKPTRSIHPETSDMLEKLLRMLAEQGEEAAFAYLRELVKAGKEY